MGATTFSRSKRNRARLARQAGKVEEAELLEKAAKKYRPKNTKKGKGMESRANDADIVVDAQMAMGEGVDVDLDGDGVPDITIKSK